MGNINFTEKKFGDIDRLSTASLTNGITDKMFGTASNFNSPLGANYPIVKSQATSSSSSTANSSTQNQKPHNVAGKFIYLSVIIYPG